MVVAEVTGVTLKVTASFTFQSHLFYCHTVSVSLCRVQLIESSCPFFFCHFHPLFSVPILFLSSLFTSLLFSSSATHHFQLPFFGPLFFFKSDFRLPLRPPTKLLLHCGPASSSPPPHTPSPTSPPNTSPPSSAPRPAPRPGGRAPPDPLPSVSAAPQQIGGMVWDFLGK